MQIPKILCVGENITFTQLWMYGCNNVGQTEMHATKPLV